MKKNIVLSKKSFCVLGIFAFLIIYLVVYYSMVLFVSKNEIYSQTIKSTELIPVIIIDPGHGGIDGGAVSETGILEKDVNLKICEYLYNYCSLSGVKCVMTRQDDIMLTPRQSVSSSRKRSDLIARTEIAQEYQNSIFISIHQNTFPSSRYSGLQVFYSKNNNESYKLAENIRMYNQNLIDKNNKREPKGAGKEIYVLDNLKSPAVLIECGFLSNAKEASMLATDLYQKKIAFMIYTSIMEYIYNNTASI